MSARERSLFRVTWFNFRVLHSFPSNLPIFANTSPSSPSTNNGNAVKKTTPDQKKNDSGAKISIKSKDKSIERQQMNENLSTYTGANCKVAFFCGHTIRLNFFLSDKNAFSGNFFVFVCTFPIKTNRKIITAVAKQKNNAIENLICVQLTVT